MTSIRNIALSAALIASVGLTTRTFAGTATANMSLSATITNNCTISAVAPAAFPYDPIVTNASAAYTTNFNISYTCTSGASPSITLGQGANPAGGSTATAPARQMANGANMLAYNVFSSAANQTTGTAAVAWGTANGPTLASGSGSAQTVAAYIAIASGQNTLPAGTYTDTVVMTVNF